LVIELKVPDQVSLLLLKILVLLQRHSIVSLVLRLDLLNLLLQILECLSLLLVLLLNVVLLLLAAGDSFLKDLLSIILLTLESLLIPLDGLLHLIIVFVNSLLLECDLLVLQSLLPLEVDLALCQLVHGGIVFGFEVFDLLNHVVPIIL